ncbi:MAG: acyltransferase [Candidatus Saccharibacteria bacterium]|nr:acyltransferase [Microbacteriaceae bacterium]
MTSATATSAEANLPEDSVALEKAKLSLSEALGGHHNSLGFIRLVLASLVIFDHAFPLGGYGADIFYTLTHGQASLGSIAVAGFFAISGYLIAKSGMSADVVQFMWRRFLRIFPAYWAVLLLTAFVVAPIIWVTQGDSLGSYFQLAPNGPVNYFTANWTLNIGTYGIYDILTDTTPYGRQIHGSAFNGSIWTLIYEWYCYLLVAVFVAFGILKRARVVVPIVTVFLFVLFIFYNVSQPTVSALIPWLSDPYRIQLTLTFMYGACLAVYSKKIPYSDGLGILSGLVMIFTLRYGGFSVVGTAAGAYFIMYLGARLPRVLQRVGAKNDYSYGVYIYGFLVEQVLAHVGWYKLGYFPYTIIALIISLGCAWLSWHVIEKRAMALKDWGPGKGWKYWLSRGETIRNLRRTPKAEPVEKA